MDSVLGSLAELTAALTALDCSTVDVCCSKLEELAPGLLRERQGIAGGGDVAQLMELRSSIRFARDLSLHAARLYDGWARVAALQGCAYTPTGQQPPETTVRRVSLNA